MRLRQRLSRLRSAGLAALLPVEYDALKGQSLKSFIRSSEHEKAAQKGALLNKDGFVEFYSNRVYVFLFLKLDNVPKAPGPQKKSEPLGKKLPPAHPNGQ